MARVLVVPLVLLSSWSPTFSGSCRPLFQDCGDEPGEDPPITEPVCVYADGGVGPDVYPEFPAEPEHLFPLERGSTWTYDVILEDPCGFNPCHNDLTAWVADNRLEGSRDAVFVESACSSITRVYSLTDAGIEQEAGDDEWRLTIAGPVAEGASWTSDGMTFTWRRVESVGVPAGLFHDCWLREAKPDTLPQTTFCPGVGTVKSVRDGYTVVLRSYEIGE